MDLQTVSQRLEAGVYATVADLKAEIDLIWSNAILFNTRESAVGKQAEVMENFTTKKFAQDGILDHMAILVRRPHRADSGLRPLAKYRPPLTTSHFALPYLSSPLLTPPHATPRLGRIADDPG